MAQQKYNDEFGTWEDDPNAQVDMQPGPVANAGQQEAPGFAPGPTATASGFPAGMDARLGEIYKNAHVDPSGRGSGFADWQYWQDVGPSQYDRLAADLAGTGTDQPTGTPGTGIWQNSGQADRNRPAPSSWAAPQMNTAQMPAPSTPVQPADNFQSQIRQKILEQMGQLGQPVTAEDPNIAAQTTAYRNERTRAAERERSALAERSAASGLLSGGESSGAFDAGVGGELEQAGQDTAGFQAKVMGQEVEQRRGHLAQLLQMAIQTGDAESARALTLQMKQMDDALAKLQMQQQGSQFQQQLGQQGAQFNANLGQQQSQFNDNFGFNQYQYANDDAYKKAVLASMGGG